MVNRQLGLPVKETGPPTEFETGASRDQRRGKGRYDLIPPIAMARLARIYELGAELRGERNWEKGWPISWCLDSAIRHCFQYLSGMRDEDHLAQAAWNLFAAMFYEDMIDKGVLPSELDDLPKEQSS